MTVVRRSSRSRRKADAIAPKARPKRSNATMPRRVVRPIGGTEEARDRFARTFADVLSGRFGGRWAVEWEHPDRGQRPFTDEK